MRDALCMALVAGMFATVAGAASGDGVVDQEDRAQVLEGPYDALVDDLLTKSLGPKEVTDQLGWKLRDQAHVALVGLGDNAVDGLLAVCNDPAEKTLRRTVAISMLAEIRSTRAVPTIITFLDSPKETLRSHAVEALGRIGTNPAVEALIGHASTPGLDPTDVSRATRAIAGVVNPDATSELIAGIRSSNHGIVAAAQQALAHIPTQEALDALTQTLDHPDAAVRMSAAAAMAGAALPEVPNRLHTVLENEQDDDVRVEILTSLLTLGDRTALDPLGVYASSGETEHIRVKATRALVASQDPATVTVLELLLLSGDPSVRANAATGLGPIADQTVLPTLQTIADHDKELTVREAAAASIKQIEARTQDTPPTE